MIFGDGEIAEIAHFYLTHDAPVRVAAFCVDGKLLKKDSLRGLPVVARETVREAFPVDSHQMFMALGYRGVNRVRADKYTELKSMGYGFINYISSKACVWPGLVTGENVFILEQNVIQPFVRIGNGVTLWSGNHVGHHSCIGDHCFIASHVVISGGVEIGARTFVGVNATLRDHVKIGEACVIGAGALIVKDCPDKSVVSGIAGELSAVPSDRLRGI